MGAGELDLWRATVLTRELAQLVPALDASPAVPEPLRTSTATSAGDTFGADGAGAFGSGSGSGSGCGSAERCSKKACRVSASSSLRM